MTHLKVGFVCPSKSPINLHPYCQTVAIIEPTNGLHNRLRTPTSASPLKHELTPHQLSGLTLTTSTLYLTILLHRHNRFEQSHLLARSAASLTSITDPPPLVLPPSERVERAGILEMAKDRWNRELVDNVRKVNAVDWKSVREDVEDMAIGVWRALRKGASEVREESP